MLVEDRIYLVCEKSISDAIPCWSNLTPCCKQFATIAYSCVAALVFMSRLGTTTRYLYEPNKAIIMNCLVWGWFLFISGALQALAAALAYMSGATELSSRSLLDAQPVSSRVFHNITISEFDLTIFFLIYLWSLITNLHFLITSSSCSIAHFFHLSRLLLFCKCMPQTQKILHQTMQNYDFETNTWNTRASSKAGNGSSILNQQSSKQSY